uniref:Uncharacterized protein n=1 Tax=Mustela putorius furo TaxID=9669 RepID=M3XVA5_MUSPF
MIFHEGSKGQSLIHSVCQALRHTALDMQQSPWVPLAPLLPVSSSPGLLTSSEEDALAGVDASKAHNVQVLTIATEGETRTYC